MIESPQNEKLKTIRKLQEKKHRRASNSFAAEGEDLVAAALAAGWQPQLILATPEAPSELANHETAELITPEALASASVLGSGTRVIGVFEQRWSHPGGELSVYLDGVTDPGNIGTVLRSAVAFCDGPVVLGPGCSDPYSPKAVRASMGAIFARPPAQAELADLKATTIALDAVAGQELGELDVSPPAVICVGAEREGLSAKSMSDAEIKARLAMREQGPESVNAGVAASIALYTLQQRFETASAK